MSRVAVVCVVAMAVVALGWFSVAMSQESQPAPGRPGTGGWGPGGQMDPEQMKKIAEQFRGRMSQYMKEQLGATDEEWTVLAPKIEKVQTLATQARGGPMMMGMGGRFMFGQPQDEAARPEVEKKAEALRKVLQNKEAKAEEIKTAMSDYRDARAKVRDEYEKAQKDLKTVLTVRQEAQLVTMGILE